VKYIPGEMTRGIRTTVTVDDGPRPRRRKKNTSVIIAILILLIIGFFMLNRTRQAATFYPQPASHRR